MADCRGLNVEWEGPNRAKREGNHENSVSGLFPKEDHEWIKWIQDGKHIRIDQKDKVQSIISSLRTNPAESTRIGLNLESVAKIVNEFENSTIPEEKSEENSSNTQENSSKVVDGKSAIGRTNPTGLKGKRINGTTATKDMAHYSA